MGWLSRTLTLQIWHQKPQLSTHRNSPFSWLYPARLAHCKIRSFYGLTQELRRVFKAGRDRRRPCPDKMGSVCPKHKTCHFWFYVLNSRPEKLWVSRFFCRKRVPHHNFWFQKVPQLCCDNITKGCPYLRTSSELDLFPVSYSVKRI